MEAAAGGEAMVIGQRNVSNSLAARIKVFLLNVPYGLVLNLLPQRGWLLVHTSVPLMCFPLCYCAYILLYICV